MASLAIEMQNILLKEILNFKQFILFTERNTQRNQFPNSKAKMFCIKIAKVFSCICSVTMDEDSQVMKALELSDCLISLTDSMIGRNGIQTFSNLLNVLEYLIKAIVFEQEFFDGMFLKNRELSQLLVNLQEVHVADGVDGTIDSNRDYPIPPVSASGNLDPPGGSNKSYLQLVSDVLHFSHNSGMRIVDTYVATHTISNCDYLLVLYDNYSGPLPIWSSHCNIFWKSMYQRNVDIAVDDEEETNYHTFLLSQPSDARDLLEDFAQTPCFQFMEKRSDLICMYPSIEVTFDGQHFQFEPVIVARVKVADFVPINEPKLPSSLTFPSGRERRIKVQDGWIFNYSMDTQSTMSASALKGTSIPSNTNVVTDQFPVEINLGCGVGHIDQLDACGTVAAVVTSKKTDEQFLLTCEHVWQGIVNAEEQSPKMTPDGNFVLNFPSAQARKRKLVRSIESGLNTSLNQGSIIDNILIHHDCQKLKKELLVLPTDDVSLKQLHDYVYTNHLELDVNKSDVVLLTDTHKVTCNGCLVDVNGNIALIPLKKPIPVNIDIHRVITLEMLHSAWTRYAKIGVHMQGAAAGKREGFISRPTHLNASLEPAFFPSHSSQTLELRKQRCLFNQLIVTGSSFGLHGDSGGLVYYDELMRRDSKNVVYRSAVGIFVGSLNSERTRFVVSPTEAVTASGEYEFVLTNF